MIQNNPSIDISTRLIINIYFVKLPRYRHPFPHYCCRVAQLRTVLSAALQVLPLEVPDIHPIRPNKIEIGKENKNDRKATLNLSSSRMVTLLS